MWRVTISGPGGPDLCWDCPSSDILVATLVAGGWPSLAMYVIFQTWQCWGLVPCWQWLSELPATTPIKLLRGRSSLCWRNLASQSFPEELAALVIGVSPRGQWDSWALLGLACVQFLCPLSFHSGPVWLSHLVGAQEWRLSEFTSWSHDTLHCDFEWVNYLSGCHWPGADSWFSWCCVSVCVFKILGHDDLFISDLLGFYLL